MIKNNLKTAMSVLQQANIILAECNLSMITATEVEVYLTNTTMEQLNDSKESLWNANNAVDSVEKNYNNVDMKKLLLYCYHRIRSIPEFIKNSNSEAKEVEKDLYKLVTSFITPNENVIVYAGHLSNDFNKFEISIVNSKNELYNKPVQNKKLRLDSMYNSIVDAIELDDISATLDDQKLVHLMQCYIHYNSLIKAGITKKEIMRSNYEDYNENSRKYLDDPLYDKAFRELKRELYSMPVIRTNLKEDNLYAIAACRLSEELDTCIKMYKKDGQCKFVTIPFLAQRYHLLNVLSNNISEKNIQLAFAAQNGTSVFDLQQFRSEWKESLDILANIYAFENPVQAYNPQVLHFFSRESAMKLLERQENKCEYYFAMYQAGLVSFNEMIEYEKAVNSEYDDMYRVRAVILKLTNSISVPEEAKAVPLNEVSKNPENEIVEVPPIQESDAIDVLCEPENFFSYTLDDDSLYEMMNPQLFKLFAYHSMEQITQNSEYANQARRNIDVMVKKGTFTPEMILSLYIYNEATLEDLEKTVGIEKLEELYDAEDFMDTYKRLNDFDYEKELSEEESHELEVLKGEYRFYTELFGRLGYLGNEDREVELLDYLDDLLNDKEVLKDLYKDGLLSIENLHGLNKELGLELYRENLLKNGDQKYIVLHTDEKLSTGDLIRLSNAGHINIKEVFKLYMDRKYPLDVLKDFAEGLNPDDIFSDDDFISKAKKFGVTKDSNIIDNFQRYATAYLQIKGEPTDEIKAKLYKAIGGKNARNKDFIDLYNKGLVDIKTIEVVKDTLLVDMIKQGVLKADDEEFLFRDTESEGKKYLRLTKILPFLTSDQKINLLASVYGTVDEISNPRIAFLSSYLDEVSQERVNTLDRDKPTKVSKKNGENEKSNASERTRNLFAFGEKFKAFKEMDPNYRHEVASGSYIIYFEKLNAIVLEEIYRTTSMGNDFFGTQHATYIIKGTDEVLNKLGLDKNNNFYDEFTEKLIYQNSKGVNSVEWGKLIQMYRDKVGGISKCLHTTEERWKNTLKKKIGYEDPNIREKISNCLENIEQTTLDFANKNVDNYYMEH